MPTMPARSPATGTIWQLEAAPGDTLAAGATILYVESMKMEIPVPMPCAGRIVAILVKPEDPVTEGQVLAQVEAS
jgi:urea carboxylase